MADAFKPYADDEASLTIGGLTVENGTDRISISGSLDLAKDRQGLDHARVLHGLFVAVLTVLEGERELPARAVAPKPTGTTKKPNPFQ